MVEKMMIKFNENANIFHYDLSDQERNEKRKYYRYISKKIKYYYKGIIKNDPTKCADHDFVIVPMEVD